MIPHHSYQFAIMFVTHLAKLSLRGVKRRSNLPPGNVRLPRTCALAMTTIGQVTSFFANSYQSTLRLPAAEVRDCFPVGSGISLPARPRNLQFLHATEGFKAQQGFSLTFPASCTLIEDWNSKTSPPQMKTIGSVQPEAMPWVL
jgi:hypothetical protein